MIYIDSSVALADLFTEHRIPPDALWSERLVSSKLLEYEIWNRIHVRQPMQRLAERARLLIDHVELLEMTPNVLARALRPFPIAVRTLDALHIATMDYLHQIGHTVALATFDKRMLAAAVALKIPVHPL